MSEETQKDTRPAEKVKEGVKEKLDALVRFGGFDLFESVVDGIQNVNPESKARRKIFLSEGNYAAERNQLKDKLQLWIDTLSSSENVTEIIRACEEKSETTERVFRQNMKSALEATAELERSYRSVALFYKNTESDKLKNVNIMNASMDVLQDLDNTTFIDAVEAEFKDCFDRLDLRDNYGICVIPGYLGSNKVVEKWAKFCHKNKVTLVTDFQHLDSPDDVMELFQSANLAGGDVYKSNVVMGANWLIGRPKSVEFGEEEHLHVPPAGALAGKIYQTLMSQVTAGKKHGSLNEVDAVAFDLRKSEIAQMEKMGLVPMVNEYGKVMAFSAKTLFNGDNIGLQTYSVVRTFDYISKVLMDFLNRRAFENFNAKTQREIRAQIVKFLDGICGPGKLIEKFKILRFEQDPNQKDRIYLDIHMTPYFPAKNYVFKLDGQKGDDPDSAEWQSEYAQE
ncbi:MAG: DUF5458 family protein [Flavobacteriales bacterium]|nr:DUF5458 family protein [Flavobacteriales bacterium]